MIGPVTARCADPLIDGLGDRPNVPCLIQPRSRTSRFKALCAAGAKGCMAATLLCSLSAQASSSDDKLRAMMAQAQARSASGASSPAAPVGALSAERIKERTQLLQEGEAALARLDLDAAQTAFDRAANIQHAADTEMSLVRTYMQGGQYRRALASGAHTAGAHLDVVAGSALYAWLLYAGGQNVIGQKLLAEAKARIAQNPIVIAVDQQLRSGAPVASGVLLGVPTRLAPYGKGPALPARARVVGSGVLMAGGQQALVPLALVGPSAATPVWVRNGLGALVPAKVVARLPESGVALLQLASGLPVPEALGVAAQEAFPGSAGFAVEYTATPTALPAWPMLRSGFMGGLTNNTARPDERALGIDMPPGPRGGPVFDAGGRLIGMALAAPSATSTKGKPPLFVSTVALRRELLKVSPSSSLGAPPQAAAQGRTPVDKIYETALLTTLQVITAR